jgi:hypothetical protein
VIGLAGQFAGAPEVAMFYLFLGVFGLYFWGMLHAWKVMRFLKRTMHIEKDAVSEEVTGTVKVIEPVIPNVLKDGNLENLRAYYLMQKSKHTREESEKEKAKVDLKLIVNAKSDQESATESKTAS